MAARPGPLEDARQPMGGRTGGGANTCCGVANVGPRRAALGPGGERWGRAGLVAGRAAGAARRGGRSGSQPPRERTKEGELQRPPGRSSAV